MKEYFSWIGILLDYFLNRKSKREAFVAAYFDYKNNPLDIEKKLKAQEFMCDWMGEHADLKIMDMVVNSEIPNTEYCKFLIFKNNIALLNDKKLEISKNNTELFFSIAVFQMIIILSAWILKISTLIIIKPIYFVFKENCQLDLKEIFIFNFQEISSAINAIGLLILNNFLLGLWLLFSLCCMYFSRKQIGYFSNFESWCKQNHIKVKDIDIKNKWIDIFVAITYGIIIVYILYECFRAYLSC